MSLHTDPREIIEDLKMGKFDKATAKKKIKDLLAEISSGIYTFEELDLKDEQELTDLIYKARGKALP